MKLAVDITTDRHGAFLQCMPSARGKSAIRSSREKLHIPPAVRWTRLEGPRVPGQGETTSASCSRPPLLAGVPLDTIVPELRRMLCSSVGRKHGDEPSRTASAHPPRQAACSSSGSQSSRPVWGWSWARERAGPIGRSGRARHPPCLYPWCEWLLCVARGTGLAMGSGLDVRRRRGGAFLGRRAADDDGAAGGHLFNYEKEADKGGDTRRAAGPIGLISLAASSSKSGFVMV